MQEQKNEYLSPAVCMQKDASGHQAKTPSTVRTDLRLKWVPVTADPSLPEAPILRLFLAASLHHMHTSGDHLTRHPCYKCIPCKASEINTASKACAAACIIEVDNLSGKQVMPNHAVGNACATVRLLLNCTTTCYAVPCCATVLCHVVPMCCAVLCCAVPCCAVLCCAVLCCAVLCCAMLLHVMLSSVQTRAKCPFTRVAR